LPEVAKEMVATTRSSISATAVAVTALRDPRMIVVFMCHAFLLGPDTVSDQ
jgi:hypothetical protein